MRDGERRELSRDGDTAVAAVLLAVAVAATWLVPRQTGDLYIAYAGARDVLDGKLGALDDWSFANPGRRWVNQNWGTHLLYYGTLRLAGPSGIPALKLVLIALMAAGIVAVLRAHAVSVPVALSVAAAVLVASHAYVDLRPNLVTLVACPWLYWLLVRSRRRPSLIWAAAGLVWLWSAMHAGFIFGLALLGLWCALRIAARLGGDAEERGALLPVLAAPPVALAMTAVASPFGVENLTHPFVAGTTAAWREIVEWMPIFTPFPVDERYGSRSEFLAACALLAVLVSGRLLSRVRVAHAGGRDLGAGDLALGLLATGCCLLVVAAAAPVRTTVRTPQALIVFAVVGAVAVGALLAVIVALVRRPRAERHVEATLGLDTPTVLFGVIVTAAGVGMALASRRFVPLALVVMAPLVALHLDRLRGGLARWRPLPVVVTAGVLAALALWRLAADVRHYLPENPRHPRALASLYDRMIYNDTYPHGAADFLERNGIVGRVYQDWRWEGFLHWRCPRLAVDVGGRAQQAYDAAAFRRHMAIWNGRDDAGTAADRGDALARSRVPWVLVSLRTDASGLVTALLRPGSPWTVVYFDRATNVLLADTSVPEVAAIVRRLVDGSLWFPDPGTAAVSRGLGMSFLPGVAPEQRRDALVAGNAALPKVAAYHRMVEMAHGGELPRAWLVPYLRDEWDRLGTIPGDPDERLDTLRTRKRVGELILELAGEEPAVATPLMRAALATGVGELGDAIARIEREWPP